MATYQTLRLGRLTMREDFAVSEAAGDGRQLALTGRESMGTRGGRTLLQVEQRRDDVLSLPGSMVPVVFTEKPSMNGFYAVVDSSAVLENWSGTAVMNWTANLSRIGVDTEIDIESRLSGSTTRVNDFAVTGKRWHAPSVNHNSYWSGPTIPNVIDRTSGDGVVRVYRDLAQGTNPRWAIGVADYEKGRARFIDHNGLERTGWSFRTSGASWELSNGLIRVKPGAGGAYAFDVSSWGGGAWVNKTWDLLYGTGPAVSVGAFTYVSVIQNTYESVTIRLTKDLVPGRMTVDMVLRRGGSFVELYIQHEYSTTLAVKRASATPGTSGTGYVAMTTADGNGHKSIVGSARTFTADVANTGISKATTATLDAFMGVSMSAVTGNAPVDMYAQYLGTPAEMVRGSRR